MNQILKSVGVGVCLLFFSSPLTAQERVKVGAGAEGKTVQAISTDGTSPEEEAAFEAAKIRREAVKKDPLPVTPVDPNVPILVPTEAPPTAPMGSVSGASLAPEDLSVQWLKAPRSVVTLQASTTGEPSVAQNGDNIFMTGNWYAIRSIDQGDSWTNVSPFTTFPAADGGFCCDQETIYDPVHDMYIWFLQYIQDGTDNRFRIAVAVGESEFQNNTWTYWDILPTSSGWPTNRWFDYPHISISDSELLITTNVFSTAGSFQGSTAFWFPLSDMADKGNLGWAYYTPPAGGGTLTPAQNSTSYVAQHLSNSTLRLIEHDSGSITSTNITHGAYPTSGYDCFGPDGTNPCGRPSDRIHAGWVAMGIIGFAWNAGENSAGAHPWVKVVRINESDKTVFDERAMEFNNTGVQWPSVSVNERGHLGGTVVLAGGDRNPEVYAWASDHHNAGHVDSYFMLGIAPRDYVFVQGGTNGPASNRWGDYYRTRTFRPGGLHWIGTGVVLNGGTGNANAQPQLFKFGRSEDFLDFLSQKGLAFASLAGPYLESGNSSTALNSQLPLRHPFSGPPWNFARQDFVFSMPSNIVDWVLLTAYLSNGQIATRQTGLLRNDGVVVWPNGESNLIYPGAVLGGGYYLGLDHRNHLEVISDDIKTSSMGHSFRLDGAFGSNALRISPEGYGLLWSGDGSQNNSVTAFDFTTVWLPANGTSPTYSLADFNMDGTITAFDFIQAWLPSNGKSSQYPW